jgi:choline dehydrogenase-like flavoprotein
VIFDARRIPAGDQINTDICIIGAGAAGITIALGLVDKAVDVILLEAGGFTRTASSQSLYSGEVVGLPTVPLNMSRSRFFGGSTNCWGGLCRPLEALDFRQRSWVPGSGWPLTRQDLDPYLERAHELLLLDPCNFDPGHWNIPLTRKQLTLFPLSGGRLVNAVEQMSPPAKFGRLYRSSLKKAPNVRVLLHANVTELETDEAGRRVERIHAATLKEAGFSVQSKLVVLAAGGIENARIMLASNRANPSGLGNEFDLVGRYFMDHPRFRTARVRLADQKRHRLLYDGAFSQWRRRLKSGLRVAAHMVPTEEVQTSERLANSRSYPVASYFYAGTPAYTAAKFIRQKMMERKHYGTPLGEFAGHIWKSLPVVLRRAPQVGIGVIDAIFDLEWLARDLTSKPSSSRSPIRTVGSHFRTGATRLACGRRSLTGA